MIKHHCLTSRSSRGVGVALTRDFGVGVGSQGFCTASASGNHVAVASASPESRGTRPSGRPSRPLFFLLLSPLSPPSPPPSPPPPRCARIFPGCRRGSTWRREAGTRRRMARRFGVGVGSQGFCTASASPESPGTAPGAYWAAAAAPRRLLRTGRPLQSTPPVNAGPSGGSLPPRCHRLPHLA